MNMIALFISTRNMNVSLGITGKHAQSLRGSNKTNTLHRVRVVAADGVATIEAGRLTGDLQLQSGQEKWEKGGTNSAARLRLSSRNKNYENSSYAARSDLLLLVIFDSKNYATMVVGLAPSM